MLLPNKIFNYNDSVLSKFSIILKELEVSPLSISDLYVKVHKKLANINEYIIILDCLYVLEKIKYDKEEGILKYVS